MWKTAALTLTVGCLLLAGSPAQARAEAGGYDAAHPALEKPDLLRVPPAIELLARTPFYSSVDDIPDRPAGYLSPQQVTVLGGEPSWSRGESRWRIQTWLGDRWIAPRPWNIDVPPPERIMLLETTPIYAAQNDEAEPSAWLSPQEVVVTGAEKQWYYTNDGDDAKKWLRIQTSWLGEQWVHLPVNRITAVKPVDQRAFYYQAAVYNQPPLLDPYMSANGLLNAEFAHIVQIAQTPFAQSYAIASENGPLWTTHPGVAIYPASGTVAIRSETPLYGKLQNMGEPERETMLLKPPLTVQQIEETAPIPYAANLGSWLHVRIDGEHGAAGTEGWINIQLAEPPNPVKGEWELHLSAIRELYRYPGLRFPEGGRTVPTGVLRATAYWDDANDLRWYRIETEQGAGWLQSAQDRISLPGEPGLPSFAFQRASIRQLERSGDTLLLGGAAAGYVAEEESYVSLQALAPYYGLTVGGADADGWAGITTETPYAFRIRHSDRQVELRWQDRRSGSWTLSRAATLRNGEWMLTVADAARLLGGYARPISGTPWTMIVAKSYEAASPDIAWTVADGALKVDALLYDDIGGTGGREPGRQPRLVVYPQGGEREAGVTALPVPLAGAGDTHPMTFRLQADVPLKPGVNRLTAALVLGERTLWAHDFEADGAQR